MSETIHQRRGRFIKTLLVWHRMSPNDLATMLQVTCDTAYKKLDGRRAFTSDDLIVIADHLQVDAGMLLRPPEALPVLGALAVSTRSRCTEVPCGQSLWPVAA